MHASIISVWNDLVVMGVILCRKPGEPRWRLPVRHTPQAVKEWTRRRICRAVRPEAA